MAASWSSPSLLDPSRGEICVMLTLALISRTRLTCSRSSSWMRSKVISPIGSGAPARAGSGTEPPATATESSRVCFSAVVTGSPAGAKERASDKASGALKITMAIHVKPMAHGRHLTLRLSGERDIRFRVLLPSDAERKSQGVTVTRQDSVLSWVLLPRRPICGLSPGGSGLWPIGIRMGGGGVTERVVRRRGRLGIPGWQGRHGDRRKPGDRQGGRLEVRRGRRQSRGQLPYVGRGGPSGRPRD